MLRLLLLAAVTLVTAQGGSRITTPPRPAQWLPDLPIAPLNSQNARCREHSSMLSNAIQNGTLWAVRMWESSAHSLVGWMEGGVMSLGSFDECLKTRGPMPPQYCLARILIHPGALQNLQLDGKVSNMRSIRWGLCSPAACPASELQAAVEDVLPIGVSAEIKPEDCFSSYQVQQPLDSVDLGFLALVAAIGALTIIGTTLDQRCSQDESLPTRLLRSFSLKRNWKQLLEVRKPTASGLNLHSIDTLRVFGTLLLIIGHVAFLDLFGPHDNEIMYEESTRDLRLAFMVEAQMYVEMFLVMSGFFAAMSQVGSSARSPIGQIIHRYLRITPSVATLVFFLSSFRMRMGSGPQWAATVLQEGYACRKTWKNLLLHVDAYLTDSRYTGQVGFQCGQHLWYLSADMHMFVLATLILLPLLKWRKLVGWITLGVALVISVVVPFLIALQSGWPAFVNWAPSEFNIDNSFRTKYAQTHLRVAPYLVGLAAGVWVQTANKRTPPFRLSKAASNILVILGGAGVYAVMTTSQWIQYVREPLPPLPAALCFSLHRLFIGLSFALMIVGLSVRSSGSSKPSWTITFLAKLSYGMYLTHFPLEFTVMSYRRHPISISTFLIAWNALPAIVLSIAMAMVLYLFVESPVVNFYAELTRPTRCTGTETRKANGNTEGINGKAVTDSNSQNGHLKES